MDLWQLSLSNLSNWWTFCWRWLSIWLPRTSGEYDGWMPCLGLRCWRLLRTLSLCCPQRSTELTMWKICKVSAMILTEGVICPKMWVSHWHTIYFKAMPDVLKQLPRQLLWLLDCLASGAHEAPWTWGRMLRRSCHMWARCNGARVQCTCDPIFTSENVGCEGPFF